MPISPTSPHAAGFSSSVDPVPRHASHLIGPEHRSALASLKLAIYAADAMRVLSRIEQQADLSEDFEASIRSICPDWRNPGWLEEPTGLLVSVLTYSADVLQTLFVEPEPEPEPDAGDGEERK